MNDDSNNISVLIFQEITITSFGTTVSVSHILFIFCKGKGIFCCKFTVTDLCNIDFFMWSYTNCWQILCESCVHCHVIRVQPQSKVIRIGNYGLTIYMYSVYYSSSWLLIFFPSVGIILDLSLVTLPRQHTERWQRVTVHRAL